MRFQRLFQIPVFLLFLLLLWRAAYPLPPWLDVEFFLRLDPLLSLGTMVAAREFIPGLAWAFVVMGVALIVGRLFCGYLCPMGTTIDLADRLGGRRRKGGGGNSLERSGRYRHLKYLFLAGTLGTSILGISSVLFFSPLS